MGHDIRLSIILLLAFLFNFGVCRSRVDIQIGTLAGIAWPYVVLIPPITESRNMTIDQMKILFDLTPHIDLSKNQTLLTAAGTYWGDKGILYFAITTSRYDRFNGIEPPTKSYFVIGDLANSEWKVVPITSQSWNNTLWTLVIDPKTSQIYSFVKHLGGYLEGAVELGIIITNSTSAYFLPTDGQFQPPKSYDGTSTVAATLDRGGQSFILQSYASTQYDPNYFAPFYYIVDIDKWGKPQYVIPQWYYSTYEIMGSIFVETQKTLYAIAFPNPEDTLMQLCSVDLSASNQGPNCIDSISDLYCTSSYSTYEDDGTLYAVITPDCVNTYNYLPYYSIQVTSLFDGSSTYIVNLVNTSSTNPVLTMFVINDNSQLSYSMQNAEGFSDDSKRKKKKK
jgi:hypothetical protein